jgi:Outer membrane protein beta-barrel family/Carboxypeptidase regulatory-like domain
MKNLSLRIFFLSILLIGLCLHSVAQQGNPGMVSGSVSDTSSKQSMNGATLTLFDLNDSNATPKYETAKAKGAFAVRNIAEGRYRLLITFEGYENQSKMFAVTKANPVIDLGNIVMARKSTMLQEVIIEKPPITIKKDTVEFDAGSYKTKPNAVAEDLFKKLPGVQVDKSGTITAQGEQVQRILVDGKRFFSDDPKLASKNLPPDVIDKIQVFDDLSDQSKFTGFDDGNRVKTINIVTKKDKRKGFFGKVVAGAGTDEAYDNSFNIHRFNGNQQVSVLGQANDVNKQNFTIQDILGTSGTGAKGGGGGGNRGGAGGSGNAGGTGAGVTTTWAAGLNYRDNWSPTTQVYGSYFFNSQHVTTDQQSLTQNIQPDSTTFTNQASRSVRRNENHRINFNVEQQLDSNNSFIFRPNIGFQHTGTVSNQQSQYTSGTAGGLPVYDTKSNGAQSNDGNSGQYDLLFRHKFAKKFRTLSVDMNVQNSLNNGLGTNYALNSHFSPTDYTDTLDQHIVTGSTGLTVSHTLSYTEPVGKNKILEFNYNYSYSKNTAERYTYALDDLSSKYDRFDSLYSNAFQNNYNSNRLTVNYRIQNTKYNLSVGSGLQQGNLNSINTTKNTDVTQHYINLTPTVNFQYLFSKTQNIRINYSGRTGQPSINQLQPIVTTSDSINFSQGNPNLKQQFTQSLRMLYTNFNTVTQRVIFATINASMISNDIQSSVTYLPSPPNAKGSTITMPVNLNGTFTLNGYFNYGFALKKPKSNLNFITNAGYNQSQTLVNSLSDYVRNTTLAETVSWTTNLKDNFDMNFSSATTYYITKNSLKPTLNQNYYTEVLSAEITYYTKSGWLVATDFDYTYNANRAPGYNASIPLLNPSIAKQIFKNKQGEIRLSVFDLLNQNVSVARTVSSNTIQDSKTNVLTRYAMLTFTYNLRKFAGQGQKMPGMFRGMRNGMRNMPGGFDGGGGGNRRGNQ